MTARALFAARPGRRGGDRDRDRRSRLGCRRRTIRSDPDRHGHARRRVRRPGVAHRRHHRRPRRTSARCRRHDGRRRSGHRRRRQPRDHPRTGGGTRRAGGRAGGCRSSARCRPAPGCSTPTSRSASALVATLFGGDATGCTVPGTTSTSGPPSVADAMTHVVLCARVAVLGSEAIASCDGDTPAGSDAGLPSSVAALATDAQACASATVLGTRRPVPVPPAAPRRPPTRPGTAAPTPTCPTVRC